MLNGPRFHGFAGGALADGVEGRDPDLILRVGVKTSNTVACGGDALHGLKLALWGLGAVLDDVVGHRVWVARVPR